MKKLSGAQYRKEAKERVAKEEEILRKTKKLENYFMKQRPENENTSVQHEGASASHAMVADDDSMNALCSTETTETTTNPKEIPATPASEKEIISESCEE